MEIVVIVLVLIIINQINQISKYYFIHLYYNGKNIEGHSAICPQKLFQLLGYF
ncbi:hypothetical protein HMPREF2532_01933, partial [Bacteroides ovatus]